MKKFKLTCRTTFLRCWLLAITFQSGQGLSQNYPFIEEQSTPEHTWIDNTAEFDQLREFSSSQYESTPIFKENNNIQQISENHSYNFYSEPSETSFFTDINQIQPNEYRIESDLPANTYYIENSFPLTIYENESNNSFSHPNDEHSIYQGSSHPYSASSFSDKKPAQLPCYPHWQSENQQIYHFEDAYPGWSYNKELESSSNLSDSQIDFSQPSLYPFEVYPSRETSIQPTFNESTNVYLNQEDPTKYYNPETFAEPQIIYEPHAVSCYPIEAPLDSFLHLVPPPVPPMETRYPYEPHSQPIMNREFNNQFQEVGFKEAKSHTKIIKKETTTYNQLPQKEMKIIDTIGKTDWIIPPSVGLIDTQVLAERDPEQVVPIGFSQTHSKPLSQPSSSQPEKQQEIVKKALPTSDSKVSISAVNKTLVDSEIAQTEETSTTTPDITTHPSTDNTPSTETTPSPNQDILLPEQNTPSDTIPSTTTTPTPIPTPTSTPIRTPTIITPTSPTPSTPAPTTVITPSSTRTIDQRPSPLPISVPRFNTRTLIEEESNPLVPQPLKEISINFNNVSMIEYIRFISRISNKNFIFDEQDLQFNVTIVSEEPTSIENLMAALLQELRIRDLSLIEQGNNIIIHRNPRVRSPGHIVAEGIPTRPSKETEIVTRVFRLNTLDPLKASEIIRPLLSEEALVEVLRDSNNLIITDLITNVNKISELIASLDAPNSGMVIGQYAVRNTFVDTLASLAERILQPIAQGNPYVLVPHPATNSIFIVSNPFIVERALAILENLDMNEGRTKILTLEKLKLSEQARLPIAAPPAPTVITAPGVPLGPNGEPLPQEIGTEGIPVEAGSIFDRGRVIDGGLGLGIEGPPGGIITGGISTHPRWIQELPPGHPERTLFFIHKLRYRRGDQIELALRRIADSLLFAGTTNEDLISAINSAQWIESSNSLIFTGTVLALDKVRELIDEIDVPSRQVFIEMLILDTSITDALNYGVDWGTRFGGGDVAGAQAFLGSGAGALLSALDTVLPSPDLAPTVGPSSVGLARAQGYNLGVVGRHLTHNGTHFNSIAALVQAIHTDAKTNIVLNPKIITEDNNTAEVFVGSTDRFKVQSIANDQGNVITSNFQFIDVGTTLRVTPLIGNNDIITLDIVEEITNDSAGANPVGTSAADIDVNLIPVLTKSRTLTRVHVPNGFFVVMSGMIQDTQTRAKSQIPCLGGIPIIGGTSKQKRNLDTKRNLMIFIRPLIIDSDDDIENITRRQQDVYREKTKLRRSWNYEIDQALDFFNIKPADPYEIGCTLR